MSVSGIFYHKKLRRAGEGAMKTILFVTDLYYEAKGRNYYEEDLFLTSKLREAFNLVLCHPEDIEAFEDHADLIVFRNAGPVANFKDKYEAFRDRIVSKHLNTYNSFNGKGDMNGKEYLIELTNKHFPVIPTIDTLDSLSKLPDVDTYIIKPKDGADSIGTEFVTIDELSKKVHSESKNTLVQPFINFEYEVSFYFIDKELQYALYAPDKDKRWELKEYTATEEDVAFAKRFIDWNNLDWGIQRVDACRNEQGELLLVELEDLNPYLSLLELSEQTRQDFIEAMKKSLQKALQA
ncbi:ATP-grasp domain-containing protein [Leuconostoc lactis]